MQTRERVEAIVYEALNQINAARPEEMRIACNNDEALLGTSGALDSLDLVSFLLNVETGVSEQLSVSVHLTASPTIFDCGGPLTRVGLLVDYVVSLVA